jgi:pimeloyl-ACP methyl ester carboxylesterase
MAVLPLVRAGAGAPLLLVHGSAADHTTWSIQMHDRSDLAKRFELCAYDRRPGAVSIEQHADDAAAICEELGPVVAVGSSFGAVVVIDLIRRRPELVRGAVLCEPPLAASDDQPPIPDAFLARFDAIAAAEGGEAAGEYFLRQVLGDVAYMRMPRLFQARSKALWRAIRDDSAALGAYRVRYPSLGAVATPCLLLGGERSAAYFRPTIDALARALGAARVEIVPGAGHMMQAEAHRGFADAVIRFCAEVHHG